MFKREIMIFAGNANQPLAKRVAQFLDKPIGDAIVTQFSDGETHIEINENVRGCDVFIVQPTSHPTNDHLMELMVMADALRRASAYRVTAVMPYYGYSRQDRRAHSKRVPITAKVVADMLQSVGIDRVLTIDLHADQIQGFFNIPVDNAYGSQLLTEHIMQQDYDDLVVVSPDIGGVVRARATAKLLDDADLAIIDKRRPKPNESKVMNIIGEIENRSCILVDDIVDTAGTLCNAATALKERGAKAVYAYVTHPVLSGKAIENINASALDKMIVTDTIALQPEAAACEKIEVITSAALLAETINRIHKNESVSSLYD